MSQVYRTLRVAPGDKGVLSVVIDAPPMNLIGPELVRDLVMLTGELESGQDTRVMVLESADPEYFVPHVDLTKVAEYTAEAAKAGGPDDASLGMLWHKLSELPVVSIAKIRGRARGAGSERRWRATCDSPRERTPSSGRSRSASAPPRARAACSTWPGCRDGAGPWRRSWARTTSTPRWPNGTAGSTGRCPTPGLDVFVARLARRIASFPADAVRTAKRALNEQTRPARTRSAPTPGGSASWSSRTRPKPARPPCSRRACRPAARSNSTSATASELSERPELVLGADDGVVDGDARGSGAPGCRTPVASRKSVSTSVSRRWATSEAAAS